MIVNSTPLAVLVSLTLVSKPLSLTNFKDSLIVLTAIRGSDTLTRLATFLVFFGAFFFLAG